MTRLTKRPTWKPCPRNFRNEVRGRGGETPAEVPSPRRDKDLIILAVDEAVSSVVQYARYKGFQSQGTLTVDIDDVRFKATLVDSLNVFELRGGLNDTQMAESLARENSYTIGAFLTRQIMDEISYVYRKGFPT